MELIPAARNGRLDEHPATDPPRYPSSRASAEPFLYPYSAHRTPAKTTAATIFSPTGIPVHRIPAARQSSQASASSTASQAARESDRTSRQPTTSTATGPASGSRRRASPAYRPDRRETGADDPANGQVTAVRPPDSSNCREPEKGSAVGRKYVPTTGKIRPPPARSSRTGRSLRGRAARRAPARCEPTGIPANREIHSKIGRASASPRP